MPVPILVRIGNQLYRLNQTEVFAASNFFYANDQAYQVTTWKGDTPVFREVSLAFVWTYLPVVHTYHLKNAGEGPLLLVRWMEEVYLFPHPYSIVFLKNDTFKVAVKIEWPPQKGVRTWGKLLWMFSISELPVILPQAVKI